AVRVRLARLPRAAPTAIELAATAQRRAIRQRLPDPVHAALVQRTRATPALGARLRGDTAAAVGGAHLRLRARLRAAHARAIGRRHTAPALACASRRADLALAQRAPALGAATGLALPRRLRPPEGAVRERDTARVRRRRL